MPFDILPSDVGGDKNAPLMVSVPHDSFLLNVGEQGWTESYFFHGAGQGGARPKIYGAGRETPPPLPTVRGRAEKGSKSAGLGEAGAGNILRVLIEIICCSKGNLDLHCNK